METLYFTLKMVKSKIKEAIKMMSKKGNQFGTMKVEK